MEQNWENIVNSYFSAKATVPPSSISEEDKQQNEIREYVRSLLLNKVGISLWKSWVLKVFGILAGAAGLSEAFTNDITLTPADNTVFTVSTWLGYKIYRWAEDIDKDNKKLQELFSVVQESNSLLREYLRSETDIENKDTENRLYDVQCRFINDIAIKSIYRALDKRKVSSIKYLDKNKVAELTSTMLYTLSEFLSNECSSYKQGEIKSPTLLSDDLSEKLSEELGDMIASTFKRRFWIPKIRIEQAPSSDLMLSAIGEVVWRHNNQSATNIALNLTKKGKEKEDSDISEGKTDIKSNVIIDLNGGATSGETLLSNLNTKNNKDYGTSIAHAKPEDRHKGYHKAYEALFKTINPKTGSEPFSGWFTGNNIAQVYQFFSFAAGSLMFNNPLQSNSDYTWIYRFLLSCGSIFTAVTFHHFHTWIKDSKTEDSIILARLEEVIKMLFARRLVTQDATGTHVGGEKVQKMDDIFTKTLKKLEKDGYGGKDFKVHTYAQLIGKVYSSLGVVLMKKLDENRSFEFGESDIESISEKLAMELKEYYIGKNKLNAKYCFIKPLPEQFLVNIIISTINNGSERRWVDQVNLPGTERSEELGVAA